MLTDTCTALTAVPATRRPPPAAALPRRLPAVPRLLSAGTLPRLPLIVLLLVALTSLPGCGSLYYLQAVHGEAQILVRRQPVAKVVADPRTPVLLRNTLTEVSAAREFASRQLGLPDNASYRSYADVGRPYVVWNVFAAPEFSLRPVQWCFPIVGCVAYRGYFSERRAHEFAAGLERRGLDVVVGGVPAYSTLGHLSDPILSTMLRYGDDELAAIIFHELSHQLIYVPGDSSFNEAFATTVEEEGLRRWLIERGRPEQIAAFRRQQVHEIAFLNVLRAGQARLRVLYATSMPAADMRARKHEIMQGIADDMRAAEHREGAASGYGSWMARGFNNAELSSVATYYDCVPGFQRLLAAQDGDLRKFYAAVRQLAGRPARGRDAAVCGQAPAPAPAQ